MSRKRYVMYRRASIEKRDTDRHTERHTTEERDRERQMNTTAVTNKMDIQTCIGKQVRKKSKKADVCFIQKKDFKLYDHNLK